MEITLKTDFDFKRFDCYESQEISNEIMAFFFHQMHEYIICPSNRSNKLYIIKLQDVEIVEKLLMDSPTNKIKTVRIFHDNER